MVFIRVNGDNALAPEASLNIWFYKRDCLPAKRSQKRLERSPEKIDIIKKIFVEFVLAGYLFYDVLEQLSSSILC
jgi:hypothetical protein|tara:strand:- start:561 stop:785 length:225 start_codon:yes stop_codon:yes gene_type:complete